MKKQQNFTKNLVSNMNIQVMLDHLEFVELGISPLDDDFYCALRIRENQDPGGKFLKLTSRIERAICTAGLLHRGQYRKAEERKVPYISHPLMVAEILAKHTNDENILCAAILHDTLEDTPYTKEHMIEDFGEVNHDEKIFNIVNHVTEPSLPLGPGGVKQDKRATWMRRKQAELAHIKHMSRAALFVKSADVLQNLTSLNYKYIGRGDKLFENFNASKEHIVMRYRTMIPELRKYWPENPLLPELDTALEKLLDLAQR